MSLSISRSVNRIVELKRSIADMEAAKEELKTLAAELGVGIHESSTAKVKISPRSSTTISWSSMAKDLIPAKVIEAKKSRYESSNSWLDVKIA